MLNKNDPLIGAVQEVMKRNQFEREAVKLVNEKFGVSDRKALPHEKQGAWDAAYKQVLSEGKITHPNQQVLNVHEPEKPELTSDDFRKLRAKKKTMKEGSDVTSPSSMGIKKPDYASGTPDYANKGPQMVNRTGKGSAETGMGKAQNIANQGNSDVTKTSKNSSSVMPSTMKEAKVNPYAVGMAAVKKSTGDEPPMEKKNIMKAHKIAKKIIARKKMNEGFNNRHDLSVTASDENQVVADQLNERVGNPLMLNRAKTRARIGDTGVRRSISGTNDVQTRLANMRRNAPALDTSRNAELDRPGWEKAGVAKAFSGPHGMRKSRQVDQITKDAAEFAVPSAMTGGPVGNMIARGVGGLVSKGYNWLKNAKTTTAAATTAKTGTTAAAPAATQATSNVANRFRYNAANRPYNVSGAQAKPPTAASAPATAAPAAGAATSAATTSATNATRLQAIRRSTTTYANKAIRYANKNPIKTGTGLGVGLGASAFGLGMGGAALYNKATAPSTATASTNKAPEPSKKIQDRVPQSGSLRAPSAKDLDFVKKVNNAPAPIAAATPPAAAPIPKAKPTAPATSTAPAVKKAAPTPTATTQPVRKAAPQDSSTPAQRAQFNRQIDRGVAAPGTQYKGLGATSGTKVVQKAAPQVKRPVGTGREK